MNKVERVVAGVWLGANVAAGSLMTVEALHDFNPAQVRQAEVDACAPHLPLEARQDSTTVPAACDINFANDFGHSADGIITTFNLPGRGAFISEYTPGPDYNRDRVVEYAKNSGIAGGIAALATMAIMWADAGDQKHRQGQGQQPVPKAPAIMSVREYRRRYAAKANEMVLDSTENKNQLDLYISQRNQANEPPAN